MAPEAHQSYNESKRRSDKAKEEGFNHPSNRKSLQVNDSGYSIMQNPDSIVPTSAKDSRLAKIKKALSPERVIGEIDMFVSLVQQGIAAWEQAGKQLVLMLAKDPNLFDKIRKSHPQISLDMLAVFERIGQKQIYAPLLVNNSMAARRLLELPYDVQVRYSREPIEVVVRNNGTRKIVKKELDELSRAEINQVFGIDCIRTTEQQEKIHKDRISFASHPVDAAVINPPSSIGFFKIKKTENGNMVIEPCEDNGRAHYAKILPDADGWHTVIQIFKSNDLVT